MSPTLQIGIKLASLIPAAFFATLFVQSLIRGTCTSGELLVFGALTVGSLFVAGIIWTGRG